ncbi:hypothetical protein [Bifidobacterium goeldii]|uniref:hypothetical protein n=1 Tax=Bifidobacterium goeldii TaxID=2306975 RepID=UPI000F7DB9C9|nr:hypothetical protein [Bifidobacterium goeldii]
MVIIVPSALVAGVLVASAVTAGIYQNYFIKNYIENAGRRRFVLDGATQYIKLNFINTIQ